MAWPRWFVEGGAERNSATAAAAAETVVAARSEEHTSELQSRSDLVCRLLLEKKNVLVIRLISLILLRVSGIVMRLRMFLLLITFLKASHSFRNRLLVICKNAYLFATMIMTSVSSPFSCCSGIVRLNLM